jgi:DNA invertase Pin-like site-specific DNA recombinase
MAKIGYIRVSSIEQKTDRQMDLFSKLGLNKIFQEKVSGKNTDRLQLQKMPKATFYKMVKQYEQ